MFTFSYFTVNHGHCHHVGREWKAKSFKKSYDLAIRNFKACTLHVCISFHPNERLSQSSSNYWNHSLQLIYFQISYHHCLFPTTFHVNISYPKTCWWLEKKSYAFITIGPTNPYGYIWYERLSCQNFKRNLCLLPVSSSCCGMGGGVGTKRWGDKMLICTHVELSLSYLWPQSSLLK